MGSGVAIVRVHCWKETGSWSHANYRKPISQPLFAWFFFPSIYPFWVFEGFFTEYYEQFSEGKVLLTLVHLVVHPMVKLIASLGVSQRLQASQNILGKKKEFITELKFLISNPVLSNLWNYMINSFAETASARVCNPTGSY